MTRVAQTLNTFLLFLAAVGFCATGTDERAEGDTDPLQLGDEAFREGRYSAAVEFYRSALKRDESDFTARLKLIELLARLDGREDEARTEIDIALGMESLSPEQIRSIAGICSANGFPDKAKLVYDAILKREPGDLSALLNLIEVLRSEEDVEQARERITRYEESSSSTVEGLRGIAAKCVERSRFGLAAVAYEGVLKRDDKNLAALLGMGESLKRLGRFSEAAEKLSLAAECHPAKTEAAIALGEFLLLKGDYPGAEAAFQNARKIEPKSVEAADGYARVLFSTGKYEEARQTLREALEAEPNSVVLLVSLGRALNYLGEYESAQKLFGKALAVKPGCPDAILGLGTSYRETGKLDLAKEQFLRLYDLWDAHVIGLPHLLHPREMVDVAIACALTDSPQDAIDVLEQAIKKDPTDSEAILWESRLFSERHQPTDARRELQRLLAMNPNHPEAHAELASIYVESCQYELAAESCQRALKTNPSLIRALDLLCSIQMLDFDYEKAEETARKALTINPRSLSSLSFLAACHFEQGKKNAYEEVRTKIFETNPVYSELYWIVAKACENKRRNEEAIELLQEAIALKPDYAPAYTTLGILMMREGEEEKAGTYLRKSYQLDSYDPKTTNFINLLDHMTKNFVSTRTQHFLIRWEKEKGDVLGFFLPEYVEKVYEEVCEEFGYEPRNPTLVEIFDWHDQFSARIVGLPFIATVGASLGKVVAADAPKGAAFDWKDVLRHEFVHVVTLQQSKMQIPFWFTEGLATCHEESPPPAEWDGLVARMLYLNGAVPLDDLNAYFTRPKTPIHKQAAYAQSNLICRFLYERYGRQTIRKMIELYGENLRTEQVIQRCLSMTKEESEQQIKDYIFARARDKKVAPLFLEDDWSSVEKGLKEKPEDPLLKVLHGRRILELARAAHKPNREKLDEAAEILEKVIAKDPRTLGAYSTIAEIYLVQQKYEEAKDAALKAIELDEDDFVARRCLGLAYLQMDKRKEAIEQLDRAAKLYPRAADVWFSLNRLYSEEKDEEGRIRSLEGLARAHPKDMQTAKRLAGIYISRKDYDRGIEVLQKALRYSLYDAEIYGLLVGALREKGEEKEASRYAGIGAEAAYATAISLTPFNREQVIELLKLTLELNPAHEKSKDLLRRIEKGGSKKKKPPASGT